MKTSHTKLFIIFILSRLSIIFYNREHDDVECDNVTVTQ